MIVFDDMIGDIFSNKNLNPIVKYITLNSTHYFVITILNKGEFKQIAFHNSLDIEFKNFMNLYKKCSEKKIFFSVIDATLTSDNNFTF